MTNNLVSEAAFDQLFYEWYRPICLFAWRITQSGAAAENAAIATFMKVWEQRRSFRDADHLQQFMYDTACNACPDKTVTDITAMRLHSILIARAYDLIDELPDTDRQVLGLFLFEGSSTEQIAAMLDMTTHAVTVKKFRAITLLRSYLDQTLHEEDTGLPERLKDEQHFAGDLRSFQSFDPCKQLPALKIQIGQKHRWLKKIWPYLHPQLFSSFKIRRYL